MDSEQPKQSEGTPVNKAGEEAGTLPEEGQVETPVVEGGDEGPTDKQHDIKSDGGSQNSKV